MKNRIVIALSALLMVVLSSFGYMNIELYKEVSYNDLSGDARQWVDQSKEQKRFGVYQIDENDYYFMHYTAKGQPLIRINTIIVQGDKVNIYLEDKKEKLVKDEEKMSILKLNLPRDINDVVLIYNGREIEYR